MTEEKIEQEIEEYKNRILRVEYDVDPATLNPNPYNYKLHQKPQIETMEEVFGELGVIDAVMASEKTRNVIDGHMRTEMFLEKGQLIPLVIWLDLENEEEERRAIILFNEVGKLARIDRGALEKILNDTRMREEKTRALAERLARKKKIDVKVDKDTGEIEAVAQKNDGDKDEMDALFEKLIDKWDVDKHSVWKFGDDVVIIKGDSHTKEIDEIIKEYSPDCILTDPPYGIDVVGSDGRIGLAKHFGDVLGDTEPFDPKYILQWQLPSIVWGANFFSSKMPDFPRILVWHKKGVGNESNDFADVEIAWCSEEGSARSFDHVWRGAARASERNIPRLHPTQKPIALMQWCIDEFLLQDKEGKNRKMILDMYCGSGTTAIASLKFRSIGAICVDKDPRYIAATIERIYNFLKMERKPEVVK